VPVRGLIRALFVGGVIAVGVGVYGARTWNTESPMAQLGVIAIISAGLFAAVVGIAGLVWEPERASGPRPERSRLLNAAAWRAVIAPVVALALMLTYFGLTGWWNNLGNPVASQLAVISGVIGAIAAIVAGRITRWLRVIIPAALLAGLIVWGDRLPLQSETTSKGEMIALLVIVVLVIGIAINIPQVARGRAPSPEP
jgi:hypothetical protein